MSINSEIESRIGDSLTTSTTIDPNRLPPRIKLLFTEILKPMNSDVPDESLVLDLLVKIAQLLSINRATVRSMIGETLINIYALIFMPSGAGKDKPLSLIDKHFMVVFEDHFELKAKAYKERRMRELEEEATDKYSNRAKAMKQKYIEMNLPRQLIPELSNATSEGMQALRETLDGAGFGGTFLKISEFGDYISSDNNARGEFLSLITEIFDNGTNAPKVIKGERTAKKVTGVPSNAIMHSSLAYLTSGPNYRKLMTLVDRGLARRSFLCFPGIEKFNVERPDSFDEAFRTFKDQSGEVTNNASKYREFWEEAYEATRSSMVWALTDEADKVLYAYYLYLQEAIKAISVTEDEGYRAELKGRYWKTLKLSGLIAIFEHPDQIEVSVDDIKTAIYLAEVYGNHCKEFYQIETTVDSEKIRDFFLRNLNKWKTTMEISKQKFAPSVNYFTKWFAENINDTENLLFDAGYKLEVRKFSKNGFQYRTVLLERVNQDSIKISVSADITEGYRVKEVPFSNLHLIVGADINYSASEFRDGYRDKEHWVDGNNIIILDIDGGWTRKEAKKFLVDKNLKALIATTKSHMKPKDKIPACERFRIILPVYSLFRGTAEEFSYMMENIFKFFDDKPDKVAKDVSRFYYGNPGAEYEYIEGDLLRLEMFPRSRAEEKKRDYIRPVLGWDSNSGIKRWFIENAVPGDRNNTLNKARMFANDEGIDPERFVRGINDQLQEPLDEKELRVLLRKK